MEVQSEKVAVTTRGETFLSVSGVRAFVVQPVDRDEEEADADYERMVVIVSKDSTIYLALSSWNKEDLATRHRITEKEIQTLQQEASRNWLEPTVYTGTVDGEDEDS